MNVQNPEDQMILRLLQDRGFTKSEAKQRLKNRVYKLPYHAIADLRHIQTHFGERAKQRYIEKAISIRRDAFLIALSVQAAR